MIKVALITSVLAAVAAGGGAVELDDSNFDDVALNGGKSAFVKFLAPW